MEYIKYKIFQEYKDILCYTTSKDISKPLLGSFAMHTGEDINLVRENRKDLESLFPPNASFVSIYQIHSDKILDIKKKQDINWQSLDKSIEADAIITQLKEVVLTILTADCVPVMLYDKKSKVIGAIHAGWRGSNKEITKKTVNLMVKNYNSNPKDIIAVIAPSIGKCCYEVDESVAKNFMKYRGVVEAKGDNKFMLDLKRVNLLELIESGVDKSNIEISPLCTSCSSNLLFSYRKDKQCRGRFISSIMLL